MMHHRFRVLTIIVTRIARTLTFLGSAVMNTFQPSQQEHVRLVVNRFYYEMGEYK
jgi:hypothetical protein